jgi:hypothetical protein
MLDPSLSRRYITPVTAIDVKVRCEVRGLVRIVGMTTAPIPWPIGEAKGEGTLILYKGLTSALRSEAPAAVAYWWNVPLEKVIAWREQLGGPGQPRMLKWEGKQLAKGRLKNRRIRRSRVDEQLPRRVLKRRFRRTDRPASRPWTPWEDELVREYAPSAAAVMTGRTVRAVYGRRRHLRCPDGRRASAGRVAT